MDAANGTEGLALISLEMRQQMQAEFVVGESARLEAETAGVDDALLR